MAKILPATTVAEYISTFPKNTQAILEQVRQTIMRAAPQAVETIRYGMPAFNLNGKRLIFFAGWKRHISLYPIPDGDKALLRELSHYKKGKGTIQFPIKNPIPWDLVKRIVTHLVKDAQQEKGRS